MISFCKPGLLAAIVFGFSALPAFAQTTAPIHYSLDSDSGYSQGCYPPCLCPVSFGYIPSGTFTLLYTSTDAFGFDVYAVSNVDWVLDFGPNPRHVTGSGSYRRNAASMHERMILDLSVDSAPFEHFDSGVVTAQSVFPRIEIAVSMNGMVCFDKVYYIATEPDPGVAYCFGDGSGSACPCGNTGAAGNGCATSVNPAGARLSANGAPSLSSETVQLVAYGLPDAPLLFLQGTQRASGGAGFAFGDGLLCVAGGLTRMKVAQAQNGEARLPEAGDPLLSVMAGIAAPGTYDYQIWHRDAPVFCTPSTFNLTNGYEIPWTL